MRGFRWAFIRFFMAIIFGLATFWPNIGLVFIGVSTFPAHQLPVTIGAAAWISAFFLLLPVPLWMFGRVSTAMFLLVYAICLASAAGSHLVDPSQLGFWLTWGIGGIFGAIGWLMISTPLWRLFHGVVAVQGTEPEHEHHG